MLSLLLAYFREGTVRNLKAGSHRAGQEEAFDKPHLFPTHLFAKYFWALEAVQ